jgi:hypothetical protein
MKETTIKEIVDRYLEKWASLGINQLPGEIEAEMLAPGQDPTKEWKKWVAIPSRVTDEELADFEVQIGHPLPADHKIFLRYKHFYDLQISEATFAAHPVNRWRYFLSEMIFDGYPREYLIDKGLLPFAGWSDWGLLCFDTNRNDGHANYPVVLWDHEQPYKYADFAPDFCQLLIQLDEEDKADESAE